MDWYILLDVHSAKQMINFWEKFKWKNFIKSIFLINVHGKNTEESGLYFGELKEILSRLDFNINEIDRELTVSSVELKSVDMNKPTHLVDFKCFDKNVDVSFAAPLDFGNYRC